MSVLTFPVNGRHMRIMPAEKLAKFGTFLVSFMHVWYVDKEMEQNLRNCRHRFVWFCQFHCFSSRICHLFEHYPHTPSDRR